MKKPHLYRSPAIKTSVHAETINETLEKDAISLHSAARKYHIPSFVSNVDIFCRGLETDASKSVTAKANRKKLLLSVVFLFSPVKMEIKTAALCLKLKLLQKTPRHRIDLGHRSFENCKGVFPFHNICAG